MNRSEGFDYCDNLGPEKVVHLYDAHSKMRAVVVVDNTARGPAIGGVRMAIDVTTEEVVRLGRAMTLKNAAAGLPHGGAKAGILADHKVVDKRAVIRTFAQAMAELVDYIPGPDMGTDESCMGWLHDEIGRAVGLPRALGGIPLDEIGATGYGVAQCAEVAAQYCDMDIRGATVAVEGFGNVGRHAARFLEEMGAKLIAASDSSGTIYNPAGIPVENLANIKAKSGSVTAFVDSKKLAKNALFSLTCDILIPAARPDCIHASNVDGIKAKLIVQGANIPATEEAEAALHKRGVLVIPDFIANAGGVICASVEYHGGKENDAFAQIKEKIRDNTAEILTRSLEHRLMPRHAAESMSRDRVIEAMHSRQASR